MSKSHVVTLCASYLELANKLQSIEVFISEDTTYSELSKSDKEGLCQRMSGMRAHLHTLTARLARIAPATQVPSIGQLYQNITNVTATPMTRLEYNDYREWILPIDENGEDLGYMLETCTSDVTNHSSHKGYISWVTAEMFAENYREASL